MDEYYQKPFSKKQQPQLMLRNYIYLFALLFLAACTKTSTTIEEGDPLPTIGEEPAIELISVNPTTVQSYADSIAFTISYIDGDGDLGTEDPDITSIELIDQRAPDFLIFEYHLSPRTPSGAELSIQGILNIVLENSILLDDSNTSEETTFTIRIKDRADNWSNTIETETITITN